MLHNGDLLEPMEDIWPFLSGIGSEQDAKQLRDALVLRANVNRLALTTHFDKAYAVLPDDIRYRQMKNIYEKGPQYVNTLVELFHDNAGVLESLALLRISCPGGLHAAAPVYQRILKLDPKNVKALNALGAICINANLLPQAENYLNLAIKQQPDCINARYNLSLVLYRQGRTQEALSHIHYCLSKEPDNQAAKIMLAYIENPRKLVPHDNNSSDTVASKNPN
jgi:tetratricopeptide (TPR) repeat protein